MIEKNEERIMCFCIHTGAQHNTSVYEESVSEAGHIMGVRMCLCEEKTTTERHHIAKIGGRIEYFVT